MLFQDARSVQILFLCLFLLLGLLTRDWTLQTVSIIVTIGACCICQMVGVWIVERKNCWQIQDFLSPIITGLGLSLLLRSHHLETLGIAAMAAIASKFWLRVNQKHVFNPANFGIITVLTWTQDAWVSPGQWGEEGWYVLLFLVAGGVMVGRVGRWDTSIMFLGGYAGLEALRNVWLGWTWDVWLHRQMSGSLLLFAFFMVSDPRSIPNSRTGRLIWAGAIALLTFVLRNGFFVSTAVFWALFAMTPLIILLDRVFPDDRFVWGASADVVATSEVGL